MSELTTVTQPPAPPSEPEDTAHDHWTAKFSKPIIFVIVALIGMGIYLAFSIPVAVFPATDFPRIVVGVDNGVAPIDQMQVTVTRNIEEPMNSVPGLQTIKPGLNRVNGVSMVVGQGGQVPEFQVEPDPAKLLQAQVTVPGILDAIARGNMIDSPGLLENNHELSLALVTSQTRNPAEISN